MTRTSRIRLGLYVLALAAVATGGYLGLVWAPPDREMGDVQRIMYAHVPAVWMALLCTTANFVCSLAFLVKAGWAKDALAEATAEVGMVFGVIGVTLGSIWGGCHHR